MGKRRAIIIIFVILFFLIGCTANLRKKQLENVAKDWSLVIRASQVIPVYPLTEDLQPGDVLLVSIPIEDQVTLYNKRGFLPLDQHLIRLYAKETNNSKDFYDFYNARYGIENENILPPIQWQTINKDSTKNNWDLAPHVAFLSYQFAVKTGSDVNLAIPIQGVPIALGLMNSGSASGMVSITKSYTFGLDNFRLLNRIREWASHNRNFLREYEPKEEGKYCFLRVISRVYAAGSVSVTLHNDEATNSEVGAGADRPLKSIVIDEKAAMENYNNALNSINTNLNNLLPGIKLKITTASSRSVTLNQDFDKPLVIGYIGFDMPILKGGLLGSPISTLAKLNETRLVPAKQIEGVSFYRLAAFSQINDALKTYAESGDESAKNIIVKLNKLADLLPETYPFAVYIQQSSDLVKVYQEIGHSTGKNRGFDAVMDYQQNANRSRDVLKEYLQKNKKEVNKYNQDLQKIELAINELEVKLNRESALIEAVDFVFFEKQ